MGYPIFTLAIESCSVKVKGPMKLTLFMSNTMVREDVSTPWGECKNCGVGTRSHELEPAEYEVFLEEVIVGTSDTYSAKQWEDVDEVEKYDMVLDAVVMCHRCWSNVQSSFVNMVKKNFEQWSAEVKPHATAIKRAINTQVYYDFTDKQTIDALKILAKKLKEASLDE